MNLNRFNPDDVLRDLERSYESSKAPVDLKRLDVERRRAGLFPHRDTRLLVAHERNDELNYQAFMFLSEHGRREMANFVLPEPWTMRVGTIRKEMNDLLNTRSISMDETMRAMSGHPTTDSWRRYCEAHKIQLPTTNKERAELAHSIRTAQDSASVNLLHQLIMLGVFAPDRLIQQAVEAGDEDESMYIVEQLEEILLDSKLCREEILLAQFNLSPNPDYITRVGSDRLWQHIDK